MSTKSQAASIRSEAAIEKAAVEADPRWLRVLARDRSADGKFWYSVATTGSIADRRALPEPLTQGM